MANDEFSITKEISVASEDITGRLSCFMPAALTAKIVS